MTIPIQITFRGVDASPALDEHVRKHAAKLATFSDRITHCHVAVEGPSPHHKHGGNYRVLVEVNVPGADLVVGGKPDAHFAHQDVYAAVDEAFHNAARVLQQHVQRQRGDIKLHPAHR
jgi:ribosomal subunit interface protein